MDKRETLKSMLNNIINDKPEEAAVDMHAYLSDKMKEVMGTAPQVSEPATTTEVDDTVVDDQA
jgi:hypothetical protein